MYNNNYCTIHAELYNDNYCTMHAELYNDNYCTMHAELCNNNYCTIHAELFKVTLSSCLFHMFAAKAKIRIMITTIQCMQNCAMVATVQ